MPQPALIAMALMALAGAAVAVQAPINAALGRAIDSSVAAAAISFGVGFVLLLALAVLIGDAAALPRAGLAPKWLLIGGAFGAFYVWSALWSVPILGVLTTTALLILGQITAAMLIDQFGAFGMTARDISLPRLGAAVLVTAGVILSRF